MTRRHARSLSVQRAMSENSLTRGTRISTIGALGTEGLLTALQRDHDRIFHCLLR